MYMYTYVQSTTALTATEMSKLDIVPALIIDSLSEKIDCEQVLHMVPVTYIFKCLILHEAFNLFPNPEETISLLELYFKMNTFFCHIFISY